MVGRCREFVIPVMGGIGRSSVVRFAALESSELLVNLLKDVAALVGEVVDFGGVRGEVVEFVEVDGWEPWP